MIDTKKGKLTYISDSAIPSYAANSIHVMKMCQAFSRQGYEVTLIGKRTGECVPNISDFYSFYGVDNIFSIKLFPFRAFPFSGRLFNMCIPFFSFGFKGKTYTRSIYAAFWYSLFQKEIIFEIHEPFDSKNVWLKFIFNSVIRFGVVKKWVVISQPLKRYLTENFKLKSESVIVAHDGADLPKRNSRHTPFLIGEKKVGYVGSLHQGKGMEIIVELSKKLGEVHFHIVGGNGEQIHFWRNKLFPEQNNVVFHGFVEPSDCFSYMDQCDLLIAPYQNQVFVKKDKQANNLAKWMSPLKIFEYMSVGKPIVTTNLPVIREFLEDGKSGLLCDPNRIDDWVTSISSILNSSSLADSLGRQAKMSLESDFTWEIRARKIGDFISESN